MLLPLQLQDLMFIAVGGACEVLTIGDYEVELHRAGLRFAPKIRAEIARHEALTLHTHIASHD